MKREAFANWLKQKGLQESTIKSRVGNCSTIEYYEGDLDEFYDADHCASLLKSMMYSKNDQENLCPPRHHIPVSGNVYNGTATLRSALNLYVCFKSGGTDIDRIVKKTTKESTQCTTGSQKKKAPCQFALFDYRATPEQIQILKRMIADTVIFFPPEKFKLYLERSRHSKQQVHQEWPYLIFSSKRQDGLRMRRAKTASEKRGTDLQNPDDLQETIRLTDNANNRFNTEYGDAFREVYQKQIPPERYSICHIGGNTAYDIKTFAAIPNVVYAPTWIERVTDDSPEIRRFLAARSYELYGELIKAALAAYGKSKDEAEAQIKDLYSAMQSPREGLPQEIECAFPPAYQVEEDKKIIWRDWTK